MPSVSSPRRLLAAALDLVYCFIIGSLNYEAVH